jgi:hypothetical protein
MTLQEMKQLVLELSDAEKKELSSYIGEILVDVEAHNPSVEFSEKDKIRQMLGDLLVQSSIPEPLPFDEMTIMKMLDDAFRGQPSLSDELIAERRESP